MVQPIIHKNSPVNSKYYCAFDASVKDLQSPAGHHQYRRTVLYEDTRFTWLKVAKDGKEIWAQADMAWGRGYMSTIIEKQAMAQKVVASA
jgi:hypothetical protein